jgi:hypothetical protein
MNKVQKILLGLAATAVVSSVSFADNDSQYYLTIGGGAIKGLKPSSVENGPAKTTFKAPKVGGEALIGVGYTAAENVRVEAAFVKPFFGKSDATRSVSGVDTNKGKLSAEINSLQLRGYFDAVDISDLGKGYVGAGLGWSQVKAKVDIDNVGSGSSKKANNLAWFLGVGANFEVADGAKLGIEYNYQDFGKAKSEKDKVTYKPTFKGNALIGKLSFDI